MGSSVAATRCGLRVRVRRREVTVSAALPGVFAPGSADAIRVHGGVDTELHSGGNRAIARLCCPSAGCATPGVSGRRARCDLVDS